MSAAFLIATASLAAVLAMMAGEALLSAYNERVLRARGAREATGDVFSIMRWAYPACFVIMALEGAIAGPAPPRVLAAGLVILGVAKALKMWAIGTLGVRWTFRVLVLADAPLVTRGPYAWIRHPNYVAVVGEIAGMACLVWAPIAGLVALVGFGALLVRRIAVEDRALGRE